MLKFVVIVSILFAGCSKVTVTHSSNSRDVWKHKKMVICPFTGEWKVYKSDSTFHNSPGAKYYRHELIKAVKKYRKGCVRILSREAQLVPEFEYIMWKHRNAFLKMDELDSAAFKMIKERANADLLLYMEDIKFKSTHVGGKLPMQVKEALITIQLWDLNNFKILYRAVAEGT